MYPPIVCRCGRELASLYDAYEKMSAEIIATGLPPGANPETSRFVSDVSVTPVFEALKLRKRCCQMGIMSHVEFRRYIQC